MGAWRHPVYLRLHDRPRRRETPAAIDAEVAAWPGRGPSIKWDVVEFRCWSACLRLRERGRVVCLIERAMLDGDRDFLASFPFVSCYRPGCRSRRQPIPRAVRLEVLAAGACVLCGATERLSVDHIHPVALGGSNDRSNLQCLCLPCNIRKSARVPAGSV